MGSDQGKQRRPPYATVGDLDALFVRIAKMGDPGTIDNDWVKDYKLAATQPQAIVSVLRWLGVIDAAGKSTGVWNQVRVPVTRQAKLEELVRDAYKEVFDRIDVSEATREELQGTFIQAYDSGDPGRPVTCFLALCKHAGIPTSADGRAGRAAAEKGDGGKAAANAKLAAKQGVPKPKDLPRVESPATGVTIALNVEIPAEWSEDQIRERLEAVRRATAGGATDEP